jgi:hypothetical protein
MKVPLIVTKVSGLDTREGCEAPPSLFCSASTQVGDAWFIRDDERYYRLEIIVARGYGCYHVATGEQAYDIIPYEPLFIFVDGVKPLFGLPSFESNILLDPEGLLGAPSHLILKRNSLLAPFASCDPRRRCAAVRRYLVFKETLGLGHRYPEEVLFDDECRPHFFSVGVRRDTIIKPALVDEYFYGYYPDQVLSEMLGVESVEQIAPATYALENKMLKVGGVPPLQVAGIVKNIRRILLSRFT